MVLSVIPSVAQLLSTGVLLPLVVLLLVGIVVVVGIWAEFSLIHSATSESDSGSPERKINCPACGARNAGSRTRCKYCDDTLPAGE